jgi:hypothetical protein
MMSKILKNVPVFLFWLAGFILCAHSIIPHDHHIADAFSNQGEKCPSSNSNSGHRTGFPIHCNAFNDIASDKSRSNNFSQNIQYSFFALSKSFERSDPELQVSCINIIDLQKPFFDSYALELSLLRAPPALA